MSIIEILAIIIMAPIALMAAYMAVCIVQAIIKQVFGR